MSVYRNGYFYSVITCVVRNLKLFSSLFFAWFLRRRYIGNVRVVNDPSARTADRKHEWAQDRRAATVAG